MVVFFISGDEAYKNMLQLAQLPGAPFAWNPALESQNDGKILSMFYSLPEDTRVVYLIILCATLIFLVAGLIAIPRIRRTICLTK